MAWLVTGFCIGMKYRPLSIPLDDRERDWIHQAGQLLNAFLSGQQDEILVQDSQLSSGKAPASDLLEPGWDKEGK